MKVSMFTKEEMHADQAEFHLLVLISNFVWDPWRRSLASFTGAEVNAPRFPGSLKVLTSIYKLNLLSKALWVLIFASRSLQVKLIRKGLSYFQVSDTGWFHTFTEFQSHSDIGWDDVWSRWCFPPCSFRSHAAKITVARLHDNFQVSHLPWFGCKI